MISTANESRVIDDHVITSLHLTSLWNFSVQTWESWEYRVPRMQQSITYHPPVLLTLKLTTWPPFQASTACVDGIRHRRHILVVSSTLSSIHHSNMYHMKVSSSVQHNWVTDQLWYVVALMLPSCWSQWTKSQSSLRCDVYTIRTIYPFDRLWSYSACLQRSGPPSPLINSSEKRKTLWYAIARNRLLEPPPKIPC